MSTSIYHITDVENLPSILEQGALFANHSPRLSSDNVVSIAHSTIQERRSKKKVPVSPFGTVHDYVPFYFATKSPMLYALHKGCVANYKKGQSEIIYLVSKVEQVIKDSLEFVYTDRNASLPNANFFNDFEDFTSNVDQDILKAVNWANTADDGDRKARRQAEFLVKERLPVSVIIGIGVINNNLKEKVEAICSSADAKMLIKVKGEWYFSD